MQKVTVNSTATEKRSHVSHQMSYFFFLNKTDLCSDVVHRCAQNQALR